MIVNPVAAICNYYVILYIIDWFLEEGLKRASDPNS